MGLKLSEQLIAYIATLVVLVLVLFMAFAFGAYSTHVIDKLESFGLGTAVGGLIGLLRVPSHTPPSVTATTDGAGTASVTSSPAIEPKQSSEDKADV